MRLSILIPTMTPDLLKMTTASIKANSNTSVEVIVFANDRCDEIKEVCDTYGLKMLHADGENVGIPAANNRMAREATNDVIFAADDDYYYLDGWDSELLSYMQHDVDSGKTVFSRAPVMIEPSGANPNTITKSYGVRDNFNQLQLLVDFQDKQFNMDKKANPACPCAVTKRTWDQLGGWDENFFPGWGADPDFMYRMYMINRDPECMLNAPTSFFYHFVTSTGNRMDDQGARRQEAHRRFELKHDTTIRAFEGLIRS